MHAIAGHTRESQITAAVNSLLPRGAWDKLGLAGLAISMFSMFLYLLTNIPVHHPTFSFRSYKSLPHTRSSTSKVCTLILILLCQWLANWDPFLRNFHHGLILPTSKQSIHCFFSRLMRKKMHTLYQRAEAGSDLPCRASSLYTCNAVSP